MKETKEQAIAKLNSGEYLHPVKKYWLEIAAGLREKPTNVGKRGKDVTVRAIPASKTLATRYYEQTGRRIDKEMVAQREMVEVMYHSAAEIEDPEARFAALKQASDAMAKFNQTWLPYVEQRLGTLQSEQTLEDVISLEQALENDDEDN